MCGVCLCLMWYGVCGCVCVVWHLYMLVPKLSQMMGFSWQQSHSYKPVKVAYYSLLHNKLLQNSAASNKNPLLYQFLWVGNP